MTANVIINDDNIFQNLKALLDNPEIFADANIEIGNIAPLEIKLQGTQFHHSLTTTVMKGILELQEAILRSYCIAKYDSSDLRHLEGYERNQLELVITVNAGCTELIAETKELLKAFKELLVGLSPKQKIAVISLLLISLTTMYGFNVTQDYFLQKDSNQTKLALEKDKNQTEIALEKEKTNQLLGSQRNIIDASKSDKASENTESVDTIPAESDLRNSTIKDSIKTNDIAMMNSKETESYFKIITPVTSEDLNVIEQAKIVYPQAADAFNTMSHGVERLIKSTAQADIVRYNNVVEMSGTMAKKIDFKPRQESERTVMVDEFRVLEFDSSRTDVRKTKLRSPDGIEFLAKFTDGSIGKEKIGKLNEAFWGYHPIDLSIEAKKSKGKIKDALITQVRDVNTKHSFKKDEEEDA